MSGGSERGLGQKIILALVAEQPGTTWELERRLRRRFPSSEYSRSLVRQTLGRLQAAGLVERCEPAQVDHQGRQRRVWEATADGAERSRTWVLEDVAETPAREELQAKLAFCRYEDLPRLLELVLEEERLCGARLMELGVEHAAHEAAGGHGSVTDIASGAERAWWRSRADWFGSVKALIAGALRDQGSQDQDASPQEDTGG